MKQTRNYKRVYIWQLPVRIFHWVNVLCFLTLGVTGYIIGDPPAILSNAEAIDSYWFGMVRTIHFIAAYVFFFNMLLRIYWSFVGNRFAHWKAFLPFNKKAIKSMGHVVKHDIFLINEKEYDVKNISVGHNPLAAIAYIMMFLLSLVMVFTGFGLYSDNAGWWLPKMFDWVVPMLGGDFAARIVHHTTMWIIVFIIIIHVYLVFYHEWLEGRGEVSSMFSGYKFVRQSRVKNKKEIVEQEEAITTE